MQVFSAYGRMVRVELTKERVGCCAYIMLEMKTCRLGASWEKKQKGHARWPWWASREVSLRVAGPLAVGSVRDGLGLLGRNWAAMQACLGLNLSP